ncbi:MAG TPA: hypothetical protein VJ302_16950, partial [Blastocatellia bacterium]|nr:hypothetical protein [Blastocatellia bacterium]
HSLRLDWNGDAQTSLPVATQRVLVKPEAHYRLSFWARHQNLVTGGLPGVVMVEAGGNKSPLSPFIPLSTGTNDWQKYSVEFMTGKTTRAILINLQRQNCTVVPCPIFGQTWFDDFEISPEK